MINNSMCEDITTSVCIIGSGIGGGTLAKQLSKQKKSFCIIEAGDWKGNSSNVSYENVGLDFGVRSTTTIQVGGTSNLWHGVLAPLDSIDFELRDWIPDSGWAITLGHLKPFYRQAANLLTVENYDYFMAEKLNEKLSKQLISFDFNRDYLENKLFQQPLPQINFKSIVKGVCDKSQNCHLFYNTTALEFIRENGKITALKVGNDDGNTALVHAEYFIVCAGALETPRLLLNSGMKNVNIGRYLMDHPMGNLSQFAFKKPQKYPIYSDTKYSSAMKIKSGLELKRDKQRELRLPNHNFYLRPSFIKGIDDESEKLKLSLLAFKDGKVSMQDAWKVLTNLNVIRQILAYKLSLNVTFKYADLFFVTEQIPNINSNVSLSQQRDRWGYKISKVNWQICQQDIDSMKKWFALLRNELFPESKYEFTHQAKDFNWNDVFTSAIHHVGTARMGDSPENGVVDKNLQVFGENNLYLCDGSIFTTAGNVNNGLTISAFACRLAEHLGKKI